MRRLRLRFLGSISKGEIRHGGSGYAVHVSNEDAGIHHHRGLSRMLSTCAMFNQSQDIQRYRNKQKIPTQSILLTANLRRYLDVEWYPTWICLSSSGNKEAKWSKQIPTKWGRVLMICSLLYHKQFTNLDDKNTNKSKRISYNKLLEKRQNITSKFLPQSQCRGILTTNLNLHHQQCDCRSNFDMFSFLKQLIIPYLLVDIDRVL